MNVIFHIAVGTGIVALTAENGEISKNKKISKSIFGFSLGVISHGCLDYIPHCYPINSKIDAIVGLLLISTMLFVVKKQYFLIATFTLLGSIFPDLIDLSPSVINKLLSINLPTFENFFPWHLKNYSGSLYNSNCIVSNINHILVIISVIMIYWLRRNEFKKIFKF